MSRKHRHRQRIQNACLNSAMADAFKAAFPQNEPWRQRDIPNFSLDRQIADARRDMGEDRWNELQREWEA